MVSLCCGCGCDCGGCWSPPAALLGLPSLGSKRDENRADEEEKEELALALDLRLLRRLLLLLLLLVLLDDSCMLSAGAVGILSGRVDGAEIIMEAGPPAPGENAYAP